MVTVRLPLTQVCGLAVLAVAALLTYKLSSSPFTAARRVAAPSLVLQPCAALPTADERLFGPPLPRVRLDDETPKFEPAAYRRYYPDAAAADPASGPDDNASAGAHYLEVGRTAGRVPVRLRVLFSYEASAGHHAEVIFGGLCNQMYSHIGMLTLALHMGAEPVRCQLGLGSRFSLGIVSRLASASVTTVCRAPTVRPTCSSPSQGS